MNLPSFTKITTTGLCAIALLTSSYASAAVYTSGHGDIGVGYDDTLNEFEPHWHLGSAAVVDGTALGGTGGEFAPHEIVAGISVTRNSPTGLSSSLGVADGSLIYVMGSSTYQPNLGFAVEELAGENWVGNITLSLNAVTRPSGAEFALYTTNLSGTAIVDEVFSTYDSGATVFGNELPMTPGGHSHYQWGFTEVGQYDLEYTWTGEHITDGLISTTDTFTVNVIPEPSTLFLTTLALMSSFIMLRRKR
ncbi:choice-of-anchor M domain-containing protein [Kiritimatiellota bacterium B12222]|nr:choice-of-anchor M domain-containing protein [Kiritimatiellota bacterium B12222]